MIACYYIYIKVKGSSMNLNSISGIMVSVLTSSAVDRRFEPRSDQTKLLFIASLLCTQH